MSFEPKKREEIEYDKFNIKSHLNVSFDAEGISVSEDLISRTMDAIRLQEEKDLDTGKGNMEDKRPIFLYRHSRTLVTVVAAALILVAGLNAIRMFAPLGMKSDMTESENSTNYDGTGTTEIYKTKDAPKEDRAAYDMDSSDSIKSEAENATGIAEDDVANIETDEQYIDMLMESNTEKQDEASGVNDRITASQEMLTFQDITFIGATDISLITINSMTTGDIKDISSPEQIQEFYSVMEKHEFMNGTQDITEAQYIIKLISENKDIQVVIGNISITVDYTNNDITSHSLYMTRDQSILIRDIEELLVK